MSIFVEGYETSSTVLGFAIYEMARNPDIQKCLHAEITEVLAKYYGECTFEALQEMEYLDNVIHETMRLNVVAPFISRICTKEYTLPLIDGQKEAVTIQPGTTININCRALHMLVDEIYSIFFLVVICNFLVSSFRNFIGVFYRDPQYYPDPEVFDPNRFTQEERRKRHKAVYLPFGEGPRSDNNQFLSIV